MSDDAPELDTTIPPPAGFAGDGVKWEDLSDTPGEDANYDPKTAKDEVETPVSEDAPPRVKPSKVTPTQEQTEQPEQETSEEDEEEASEEETPLEEEEIPEEEGEEAPALDIKKEPTPEEIAERKRQYEEWERGRLAGLTKAYSIDDETAERFRTEPEVVLPELAARLHHEAVQEVMRELPAIIRGEFAKNQKLYTTEMRARNEFYKGNPQLKGVSPDLITQVGMMWRKANPKATAQEAIKGIGEAVSVFVGKAAAKGEKPKVTAKPKPGFKPAGATKPGGSKPKVKASEIPEGQIDWLKESEGDF